MAAAGKHEVKCRLHWLVLLVLGSFGVKGVSTKDVPFGVSTDAQGNYFIFVGKEIWLRNAPTFITAGGRHCSTSDGSLRLVKTTNISGSDSLGHWSGISYYYQPLGSKDVILSVRKYKGQSIVVFDQEFPNGLSGTSTGNKQNVSTGFPTFRLDASLKLGYLAYGGIMFGQTGLKLGRWQGSDMNMTSGLDSGPLVLFNQQNDAMVISTFREFMASSAVYNKANLTVAWGILGTAAKIPTDFKQSTIISFSNKGINQALEDWGNAMRRYYKKSTAYRDSDLMNNYLGYWTDRGGYYWYNTEKTMNYEDTLMRVKEYATKMNLPYRYIQYDSWWYPKGPLLGVTEWTAMAKIFPSGQARLRNTTDLPVVAHNRWWSSYTGYAKEHGGNFSFVIERTTFKALPVDQEFWDYLMRTSSRWGLSTYEQDWLNVQFNDMDVTVSNVTIGRTWLMQMGKAAAKHDVTIQYCMAPSRAALQSLEIPVVTNVRVSNDYLPGNDNWKIGISSIFAHAMGVAPFKDNFWSTQKQPGNVYKLEEKYSALQSLVSTLSTGPVGPSDRIGHSNISIIMRCCNEDGLILKPSRPALAVDVQIQNQAFKLNADKGGEIWTTYSDISGWRFGIIFAVGVIGPYPITPTSALFGKVYQQTGAFAYNPANGKLSKFSEESPVKLEKCTKANFCLYYTTPSLQFRNETLLLLGELQKWVPVSPQRISDISISSNDVIISLRGAVNEVVKFTVVHGGTKLALRCTIPHSGTTRLSLAKNKCF